MSGLLKVTILLLLVCASGVNSFARESASVKVIPYDKYTRLFFYSQHPLSLNTSTNGNKLKISFKQKIAIDSIPVNLVGGEIRDVVFNENSNTATITLSGNSYKVRKFVGEDFVGIDIIKPEDRKSEEPQLTKEEIDIEPSAGHSSDVVANELKQQQIAENIIDNKTLGNVKPERIIKSSKKTNLAETPVANLAQTQSTTNVEQSKKIEPEIVNESTKLTLEVKTVATQVQQEVKQSSVVTSQEPKQDNTTYRTGMQVNDTPATTGAPKENDVLPLDRTQQSSQKIQEKTTTSSVVEPIPSLTDTIPAKEDAQKADGIESNNRNGDGEASSKDIADTLNDKLLSKIVFDWDTPVGSSVFKRAGYLWIVFDKSKNINIKDIVAKNSAYISSGTQMPNRFYTILRMQLKQDINITAYKEKNNWVVGFIKDKVVPQNPSKIDIKFSELTGSKIFLDNESPLKPLRLTDTEVGDEIVILPYMEDSTGIKEKYSYIDFVFLETVQGGAIQIISDNVDISVVDTGITIAGPANYIDNLEQAALKELKEKEEAARLGAEKLKQQTAELNILKFNTWMLGGNRAFKKDLKELEWKIAEVDWSEKSKYRLALARFYLAHGLDSEALGVVSVLREYDEKLAKENDVKMIEATAYYMMGRYKDAVDIYDTINLDELKGNNKDEVLFWRTAADINIGNQLQLDKFITKNPLKKEDEVDAVGGDKVENTKLMHDTSMRLLKMIRKMDPDFVNADELQKLEATARFVTDHYQEAIKRFEENELYSSGDIFQAEDNKLWWSTKDNKRVESAELLLLPNIDEFLKNYPVHMFNDFALLATEEALKKNDLSKVEKIMAVFKPEDRLVQKNSIEFFRGLYYAKNEEVDKAVETWNKLTKEIPDPYNRTRAQFALTVFQLDKKQIDVKQAIANLNSVRAIWRGGQLEFHILTLLGEFYIDSKQPMEGFRVWREAISAFPGSDESLLIARKMSANFIKIFSQGEADKMAPIDAITLYYEFRELTPIGKLGDEMISKLVDRLISVDLLDRAAALLTHQVRFRLIGEEKDLAASKLIKIHLTNHDPSKALDVLDATETETVKSEIKLDRKYMRAQALLELGKSNKVLSLLNDDLNKTAAFIRADVYWRNNVWRKVVDELEVPFREIRREEKKLSLDETNQVIRLAVAYALIDRQKRLQILYEDFSDLIDDPIKKKLLTFIATNKGPVDYKNLDQTVEYKYMEDFLNTYMKAPAAGSQPSIQPTPSAQAASSAPAG